MTKEELKEKIKQLKAERDKEKELADICDNSQHTYKIYLNSVYGAFGSIYYPAYDLDSAEATTLTGQRTIKEMVVYVNKVLNNLEKNSTQVSYVVAGDTDSTSYDSKIYVNDKLIEIGKVFDNLEKTEEKHFLLNGTEIIIPSMNLKTKSLNGDTNIKNISRHKVSKRKWEITINNISTYFTEDHSIMVYRNNEIVECKASEILSTDYLIIKD